MTKRNSTQPLEVTPEIEEYDGVDMGQTNSGYNLEPLNDSARSQLMVMGNSMKITIQKLTTEAPEWARFIEDVFVTIGGLMDSEQ